MFDEEDGKGGGQADAFSPPVETDYPHTWTERAGWNYGPYPQDPAGGDPGSTQMFWRQSLIESPMQPGEDFKPPHVTPGTGDIMPPANGLKEDERREGFSHPDIEMMGHKHGPEYQVNYLNGMNSDQMVAHIFKQIMSFAYGGGELNI